MPVYLLDTELPENGEAERHLTDQLYGGDSRYRLAQEALLRHFQGPSKPERMVATPGYFVPASSQETHPSEAFLQGA